MRVWGSVFALFFCSFSTVGETCPGFQSVFLWCLAQALKSLNLNQWTPFLKNPVPSEVPGVGCWQLGLCSSTRGESQHLCLSCSGSEWLYSFSIPCQPLCSSLAVGAVLKPQLISIAAVANQTPTHRINLWLAQKFSSVENTFECHSVRMPCSPANCSNQPEKQQWENAILSLWLQDLSRASRRYLSHEQKCKSRENIHGDRRKEKGMITWIILAKKVQFTDNPWSEIKRWGPWWCQWHSLWSCRGQCSGAGGVWKVTPQRSFALPQVTPVQWPGLPQQQCWGITCIDSLIAVKVEGKTTLPQAWSS